MDYLVGELFAGAGGLALGASQAQGVGAKGEVSRFRHIWATDMEADACQTFRTNIPIAPLDVHCCKVEALKFERLQKIDGLAFGFPCNDFSIIGKRQGMAGKYGGLWRWGNHGLRVFQPLFFFAENVGGLASSGDDDLGVILASFEESGYDVYPHLYRFEDYGVPQTRHRLIIVGFRRDLGIGAFRPPAPTHIGAPRTAREALAKIPSWAPNHGYTKHPSHVVERLMHIRPGENAFTAKLPKRLQLNMKSNAKISQIYRRLIPDRPSYTVTGSGGGGTHLYHWEEPRSLTNRERARIQTFPDDFRFYGGRGSVRRQIGMAVPPLGARVIFQQIMNTLLGG